MKILLFGHSGAAGGAENALRRLVGLLRERHEISVVLPALDSYEGKFFQSQGVSCYELKTMIALPHFPQALISFLHLNWAQVVSVLRQRNFDLLISNTLAILHGSLLASMLKLPHVTYVHEILEDQELIPSAIDKSHYLELVQQGSCGLIGCSESVLRQFKLGLNDKPRLCLPPFDFALPFSERPASVAPQAVLQVIGTQSYRKNVVFAGAVAKALKLLGRPVKLDFIGTRNNASAKLEQTLKKRSIDSRVLPFHEKPFSLNIDLSVITLVCSRTEPYGLTIAESLQYGVPVIASRSGGPEEILPDEMLFPVDDLDACVRRLLLIWDDYPSACSRAEALFAALKREQVQAPPDSKLDDFLYKVIQIPPLPSSPIEPLLEIVKSIVVIPISQADVLNNIDAVATIQGVDLGSEVTSGRIEKEKLHPGTAVMTDIRSFDVIPFANSKAMERLYREGLGLAVELAATFDGPERKSMAAYIGCHMWNEFRESTDPVAVLALGDGVGIDSIRLSHAGFVVDYMDYERSNMAKVAEKNFQTYNERLQCQSAPRVISQVDCFYDVVLCLEVIEHVSEPDALIRLIANCVKPRGIVYMSDCFNGIEDRWPTHLYRNEPYAGLLPMMMEPIFKLEGFNRRPYAKPYVFRKRTKDEAAPITDLQHHREVWADLIRQQLNVGF